MNKNWMLWAGLILILVVFILVWQFAPAIQRLSLIHISEPTRPY